MGSGEAAPHLASVLTPSRHPGKYMSQVPALLGGSLVSLAVSCGIRVFYDCWKEPEGRRQNSRPGWMMVDVVFTWQPFFRHGHCTICSKEVHGPGGIENFTSLQFIKHILVL